MQAPLPKSQTFTTPGGLVSTTTTQHTVQLANPLDPLSLIAATDIVSVNGRAYTSHFNARHRRTVTTSPAGRQTVTTMDAQGRPLTTQLGNLAPVMRTYDGRGRLSTITQGTGSEARTTSLTYNAARFLGTMVDAAGRTVSFTYDAAGRVISQTLPDGRVIAFSYDANGNVTSITPPGRPSHGFDYTPVDLQSAYLPPQPQPPVASPQTLYQYNVDRQLTEIIRPDGLLIDFVYDPAGRLSQQVLPGNQSVTYAYDPNTGNLLTITAPDGGTLTFAYDGTLLLSETWAGTVNGTVSRTYDNDFRVVSQSVNGGTTVNLNYDPDSLLAGTNVLSITRDPQTGLIDGTTLGPVSDAYTYSDLGEVAAYEADVNGSPTYATQYARDALGRVTEKTETMAGVTHVVDYNYDLAGRLTDVMTDGTPTAHYDYDANGNRVGGFNQQGSISATYDDQDRLLTYDTATYTYTANGELQSKADSSGTTTYTYDVLGNLTAVALPDGTQIGYVIDGKNRRIGKTVNGTLLQGFLYDGQLRIVAELDGANNIVSRFIYGSKPNVPDYMIRGGAMYRIVSDQLGSPRLVVNAADGSVAQRMEYDEFGNVLVDTSPGFQPCGFVGGLYDRDTKLVRFGARDYDPETGRWAAKDPIQLGGGDTNLYRYVSNDPVNLNDTNGMMVLGIGIEQGQTLLGNGLMETVELVADDKGNVGIAATICYGGVTDAHNFFLGGAFSASTASTIFALAGSSVDVGAMGRVWIPGIPEPGAGGSFTFGPNGITANVCGGISLGFSPFTMSSMGCTTVVTAIH